MAFRWQIAVTEQEAGCCLRDILRDKVGLSHRMLRQLKYTGQILLNGEAVTVRARAAQGDIIQLYLPETDSERVKPQRLPLSVVYEDEDLLVVNKAPDMIVHPVPPEPCGTLANAIAGYWAAKGESRPVRIITRLDRQTSGLVLIAKHALAQHLYTKEPQLLDKFYLALIEGHINPAAGLIDAPIAVNPAQPVMRHVDASGRPAQTAYQTIRHFPTASLVRARLLTGRTHQIRVHFAWQGHPIIGDEQYGSSSTLIDRQALHCQQLHLRHIRTQEELCLTAPLPADMLQALTRLQT